MYSFFHYLLSWSSFIYNELQQIIFLVSYTELGDLKWELPHPTSLKS